MVGDLTAAEAAARGVPQEWLDELVAARRALLVRIAGQERYVAIEDAGRLRDALGTALPVGVPEVFTEPVADPLGDLVGRYARTHGPFQPAEVAARLGLGVAVVAATLQRLTATGRLVTGEFRPGGSGQEWCDAEVLRSIRRRSLAKLRQEVEPVPIGTLARFTPSWQGGRRAAARYRRRPGRGRAAGRRARAGQRAGDAGAAGPGARLLPRDARRADQRRRGALGRGGWPARRRRLDQPGARRPGAAAAARAAGGARRGRRRSSSSSPAGRRCSSAGCPTWSAPPTTPRWPTWSGTSCGPAR